MNRRACHEGRARNRTGSVLAALGIALAGAGCATPGVLPRIGPPDHTVKIVFTGSCPTAVDPGPAPCGPGCLRARNGQLVLFEIKPDPAQPIVRDFELQFDPFKRGTLRSVGGKLPLVVEVQLPARTSKVYPYNVLSGTCPALDPQIIVDN